MSDDATIEVEVIPENDDSIELDEQTTSSEETQNDSEEDNSLSESKKNASNFKKLSAAKKEAEKRAAEAEKELARLKSKLDDKSDLEDVDEEDDIDVSASSTESASDIDKRLFFIENPEAKEYKDAIEAEMDEIPWLSLEKALALAKANNPKSVSSQSIVTGKQRRTVRKKMSELTESEAQSLSSAQYLQWQRSQGVQI